MKKLSYILLAAAFAFGSVACTVDEFEPAEAPAGAVRTFICSFDDEEVKTSITRQGKTVWNEGDKILLSNGTDNDTVTVSALSAGTKYCEFSTTLEGTLYVVYPCEAFNSITEDKKLVVDVPSSQSGTFGSANIACAIAEDRYVKLKNVTTVLKFEVSAAAAAPVVFASVSANEGSVAGPLAVSFTDGAPVISAVEGASYGNSVSVKVDGGVGDYYVSVIPGEYEAGFGLTAATLDLTHAYDAKTTASKQVLGINELYDLGTIASELKPMGGDGSAAKPYEVSNLAEMTVLAYYVNDGNTLKDKHVKLTNDIAGVTVPIGISDETDSNNKIYKPFQGEFDGNGKTVSLSMTQTNGRATGLFGMVADSAYIHDLKLAGSVYSNKNRVGALAGVLVSGEGGIKVVNCSNAAKVSGNQTVGGLVGWAYSTVAGTLKFENCQNSGEVTGTSSAVGGLVGYFGNGGFKSHVNACSNSGKVTGTTRVGGIAGYSYFIDYNACSNSGNVTATASNGDVYKIYTSGGKIYNSFPTGYNNGVGGISGWAQNSSLLSCKNSGTITGINKVGGISGSNYWTPTNKCENNGKVISTQWGLCGGILGWGLANADINDCINNGEVVAEKVQGTEGRWVGGIVGYMINQVGKSAIYVRRCINNGNVSGCGQGVAGIAGYTFSYNNAPNRVDIFDCANTGKITNTGTASGGIVGLMYDFGSWTGIMIDNCKNTGDIDAVNDAGGIIGYFQGRVTTSRTNLRNCENHGNILSTKKGTDNGSYAGGIIGRTNGLTKLGAYIWNALNTGKVSYSDPSFKNANVGGIAGSIYGEMWNCYNGGTVGLTEGTPVDDANKSIGALAGGLGNNKIHYSYFLEGSYSAAMGTASKIKASNTVVSATKAGVLAAEIYNTTNVVEALNSAVATQPVYYKWTVGPAFYISEPINIGSGLDLGNGGNI